MTENDENQSQAFQLGLENKREIENAKKSFEEFYRDEIKFQTEMKALVSAIDKKQDVLKERFEFGTAKTLQKLVEDFDEFRIEWGAKKTEDQIRDGKIMAIDLENKAEIDKASKEGKEAKIWVLRLAISIFAPISAALAITLILWGASKFIP